MLSTLGRRRRHRGLHFLLEVTFVAATIARVSSSRAVHNSKYASHEARQLQDLLYNEASDTCSLALNTVPTTSVLTQGNGLVFAMKSSDNDSIGVKISSFGFHVPLAMSQIVEFQVYALEKEGYYADPQRDPNTYEGDQYDYRGQISYWEMISSGSIQSSDLIASDTTTSSDYDFYAIPFEEFKATQISPNGGIRSFFINTTLLYTDPTADADINDEQLLQGYDDPAAPKLLVGEGANGFSTTMFMYYERAFVGKVFYETDCVTESPSASPSKALTLSPTPPVGPAQKAGAAASLLFPLLSCDPNVAVIPEEVRNAVGAQVTQTVSTGDSKGVGNILSTVLNAIVHCNKRQMIGDDGRPNRLLPIQSSSMEFSLVITGEYRATGDDQPDIDMGSIVEDSINADKTKFTKDLKARSSNPLLEQAMEPEVTATTLDDNELDQFNNNSLQLTSRPIPSPTPPPQDKTKAVLLILIIIISGVMVVLGAFLLFRHAERRAIESRRKKMDRMYEQREPAVEAENLKQEWEKQEWEKEINMRKASNSWQSAKKQSEYPPYYGGPPPSQHVHPHDSHYPPSSYDSMEDSDENQ